MPRFKSLAVLCALVASPLAAQADLPVDSPHQVTATAVRPAPPVTPQLYFAALPEQLDGRRILAFEVWLNGKLHLQESVFLETAATEGSAFELLASRPDLRARLTRLAARPGNRLQVRISADQEVIRSFPAWQRFLFYNQRLAAEGVTPRQAFSLVLDHTNPGGGVRNVTDKGMQLDPVCADQCNADYQYCLDTTGCDYGDCSRCQDTYYHCLDNCMICVEPKSQTTNTSSQNWNGPSGTGNFGCYRPNGGSLGHAYRETVMQKKNTTTVTTTYCNNTTSTVVTNVNYTYHYCWEPIYQSCGFGTPSLSYPTCGF